MPTILMAVECVGISGAFSAIAWLRRLSGMRLDYHLAGGLFVTPILTVVCLVLGILMVTDEQQRGVFHPDTSPTAVGLALFLGVVLAGMVGWAVVEARQFHARSQGAPPGVLLDEDDEGRSAHHAGEGWNRAQ